jgi:formate hydrogenlyase subunit 3/multisubunit Na+/H+ antiporter MnhD subunit
VSAVLFVTPATHGPRVARAVRPMLVLCAVGVIVVDNVFEFLILFELTVVAIYALISVRYQDPRASRAASLTLTLAKLGGSGARRAGPARRGGWKLLVRAAGPRRPASF